MSKKKKKMSVILWTEACESDCIRFWWCLCSAHTQSYLPNLIELHKHAHIEESWLNTSCHCQIPSGQSCLCCSYSVTPSVWFWLTRILKHFGSVQVLLSAVCPVVPPLPCNHVYADGGIWVSRSKSTLKRCAPPMSSWREKCETGTRTRPTSLQTVASFR